MKENLELVKEIVSTLDSSQSADVIREYLMQDIYQSWALIIILAIFVIGLTAVFSFCIYNSFRDNF